MKFEEWQKAVLNRVLINQLHIMSALMTHSETFNRKFLEESIKHTDEMIKASELITDV